MAVYKCSMLMNFASNFNGGANLTRTGGFSEQFYDIGDDFGTIRASFEALCKKRAVLLPTGTAIIGQRYQTVSPVGPSRLYSKNFPGPAGTPSDIPQMALYCKAVALNSRNVRQLKIKAIPDDQVKYGEYQPDSAFKGQVTSYLKYISTNTWFFRGLDLDQLSYPVMTAVVAGNDATVEVETPTPYVVGDFVKILRTTNSSGRQVGGRFRISAISGSRILTLQNWTLGATTGGTIRKDLVIYPEIGDITVVEITVCKIGRPSRGYRGRRSKIA